MAKIIDLQEHKKKKAEENMGDVTFALCSCTTEDKQGFLPVVRHSENDPPELLYLLCLNCEAELPVSGYLG